MRNRIKLLTMVAVLLAATVGWQTSLWGQTAQADQSVARSKSKARKAPKHKRKVTKSVSGQTQRPNSLPTGTWGGQHISLDATSSGAHLEFDCANGEINQPVMLDGNNAFDVAGVYVQEHGGPVRIDEQPNGQPARYSGRVEGQTMTLTITLTDKQQTIGTYTLGHGQSPRIFKCL
ncbi:MAG: hypothetical protein ACJ74W_24500 [Pyrinomonadaceae bacterium]